MKKSGTVRMARAFGLLTAAAMLIGTVAPAAAAGPKVLGANEEPRGYSLGEAAAATAYFNVGQRDTSTLGVLPAAFQGRPFQMLYIPQGAGSLSATFSVRTGTVLYVPVLYAYDGGFPFPDVDNQHAVADYFFDAAQSNVGVLTISVDGVTTTVGREYSVGAHTPNLPGSRGDLYAVVAAFIAPLAPGSHQVVAVGPGFTITYTVNVR